VWEPRTFLITNKLYQQPYQLQQLHLQQQYKLQQLQQRAAQPTLVQIHPSLSPKNSVASSLGIHAVQATKTTNPYSSRYIIGGDPDIPYALQTSTRPIIPPSQQYKVSLFGHPQSSQQSSLGSQLHLHYPQTYLPTQHLHHISRQPPPVQTQTQSQTTSIPTHQHIIQIPPPIPQTFHVQVPNVQNHLQNQPHQSQTQQHQPQEPQYDVKPESESQISTPLGEHQ